MKIYILILVAIYILPRVFFYSREGDIDLYNKGIDKENIQKKNEKEVMERMHQLVVYNEKKVRWPFHVMLALAGSFILLYLLRDSSLITCENVLASCIFLFILIEVPGRYEAAHVRAIQSYESGLLMSRFEALQSNKLTKPSNKQSDKSK